MPGQQKKSLNTVNAGCYIFHAITVLMVGCGSPLQLPATQSAARAFFIVATFFAIERQIMVWRALFSAGTSPVVTHNDVLHTTMSMVAQAGPTSVGPVSGNAGTSTPVWAIASKCGSFSDSMISCYQRLPSWLQPQQKNTQNPRSTIPNSATTAAVRFTVRRWWRYIFTLIYWPLISRRSRYICRTYSLTSTTILRL
ncbi:hypothetical protein JYL57_001505 [Salmonella enterica subsp. enterica serovar Typhimurium]|nr:hypothetical protein [Salmonella enterica subsp. enterica serovar Typhimurium]